MAEPDPQALMTCPYNPAHQVARYRMPVHLQKCRKQYPNCDKGTCQFDVTHIVNDVELEYHMSICSKRGLLDRHLYAVDDDERPPCEVQGTLPTGPEESWEDDNVESYKPDPAKKGSHIITKIKGATPSERRKARMEGIKTYRPLEPGTDPGPNRGSDSDNEPKPGPSSS